MPELAAIFSVGFVLTAAFAALNLFLIHKSFRSEKLHTLNQNLAMLNLFWAKESGSLLKISTDKDRAEMRKKDYKKSMNSALLFGVIATFLSWFGFLLFFLYFISVHKLAKSRLEIQIFESNLTTQVLPTAKDVEQICLDLNALA